MVFNVACIYRACVGYIGMRIVGYFLHTYVLTFTQLYFCSRLAAICTVIKDFRGEKYNNESIDLFFVSHLVWD